MNTSPDPAPLLACGFTPHKDGFQLASDPCITAEFEPHRGDIRLAMRMKASVDDLEHGWVTYLPVPLIMGSVKATVQGLLDTKQRWKARVG